MKWRRPLPRTQSQKMCRRRLKTTTKNKLFTQTQLPVVSMTGVPELIEALTGSQVTDLKLDLCDLDRTSSMRPTVFLLRLLALLGPTTPGRRSMFGELVVAPVRRVLGACHQQRLFSPG